MSGGVLSGHLGVRLAVIAVVGLAGFVLPSCSRSPDTPDPAGGASDKASAYSGVADIGPGDPAYPARQEIDRLSTAIRKRPEDAKAYYDRGVLARRLSMRRAPRSRLELAKAALADFEKAQELSGQDGMAEALVGASLVSSDLFRQHEAAEFAKRAQTLAPDDLGVRVVAAIAKGADEGQWNEAKRLLADLATVEAGAANADLWTGLGDCCSALREFGQARDSYRRSLEIVPENPTTRLKLAEALTELGEVKAAQETATPQITVSEEDILFANDHASKLDGGGNPQDAKALLRYTLELAPGFPAAWNNLGCACKKLGELDAALFAYQRALALVPFYGQAYLNIGAVHVAKGDRKKAKNAYEMAAFVESQTPSLLLSAGKRLADIGEYEASEKALRKCVEVTPKYSWGWAALGESQWNQGKRQEGEESLRKSVKLNRDDPKALLLLSGILIEKKEMEEAGQLLEQVIRLDPKNLAALVNMGYVREERGEEAVGLAYYDQARTLDPAYWPGVGNACRLQSKHGRFEDVVTRLNDFIGRRADFGPAYQSRGLTFFHQGKPADAIADLDRAIELQPAAEVRLAYLLRGLARLLQGNEQAAEADLKQAADLDAGNPYPPLGLWEIYLGRGDSTMAEQMLEVARSRCAPDSWPRPVVEHLAGATDIEALLAAAQDDNARCEALYYTGVKLLAAGKTEEARNCFAKCAETSNLVVFERAMAAARLEQLGGQ